MHNLNFRKLREWVKSKGISEEESRNDLYKNNDVPNPDDGVEEFIRKIYHPTSEELSTEEALLQLESQEGSSM